jgi:isoamylase
MSCLYSGADSCRAGPLNDFQWGKLEQSSELFRFFSAATRFRRDHPLLGRDRFLGPDDVTWHETNWDDPESKFLAWTLHAPDGEGSLYAAFNAHHFALADVPLPKPPAGCYWSRVADTNLPTPRDFDAAGDVPLSASYTFTPYSTVLARAVRGASSKL